MSSENWQQYKRFILGAAVFLILFSVLHLLTVGDVGKDRIFFDEDAEIYQDTEIHETDLVNEDDLAVLGQYAGTHLSALDEDVFALLDRRVQGVTTNFFDDFWSVLLATDAVIEPVEKSSFLELQGEIRYESSIPYLSYLLIDTETNKLWATQYQGDDTSVFAFVDEDTYYPKRFFAKHAELQDIITEYRVEGNVSAFYDIQELVHTKDVTWDMIREDFPWFYDRVGHLLGAEYADQFLSPFDVPVVREVNMQIDGDFLYFETESLFDGISILSVIVFDQKQDRLYAAELDTYDYRIRVFQEDPDLIPVHIFDLIR